MRQYRRAPSTNSVSKHPCKRGASTCSCISTDFFTHKAYSIPFQAQKFSDRQPRLQQGTVCKFSVSSSANIRQQTSSVQLSAVSCQAGCAGKELSVDEVEEALDHAASFITMLPLLRPVDPMLFNPAYEIWTRIATIPPKHRHQLLERLEDGSIRILWKYSVFRYVWDEEQTNICMRDYSLLDDFPSEPGQVFTFLGRVEKCMLKAEERLDQLESGVIPVAPQDYQTEPTGQRFEQFFFLHPQTRDLFSRVKMPNWMGLVPWSLVPWYCRADMQLVTTPVKADAGADVTLVYQDNPSEHKALLSDKDLPFWWWPDPVDDMESPHSESDRDYLRACGPGVYVGCAYFTPRPGEYEEGNFKFFLLVKDPSKDRCAELPRAVADES